MQALNALPGGFPDAHIGVVSTDLGTPYVDTCVVGGDGGRLQHTPRVLGCTPPGEPYIDIANANGSLSGNIANVDTPTEDGLGCQGLVDGGGLPIPADGDIAIDVCDIQAAFRCIAALGNQGCGFEQPLESARRALTCTATESCTNPGFRRDDAMLAVVFIGDEDDCSARRDDLFNPAATATLGPTTSFRCFEYGITCSPAIARMAQTLEDCRSKTAADVDSPDDLYLYPVADYHDFFSTLGPEGRVILAGITGPYRDGDTIVTVSSASFWDLEPACTGPEMDDRAAPSVRVNELIRQFGENGVVLQDVNTNVGICTDDFSPALAALGKAVRRGDRRGCVPARLIHETAEGVEAVTDPADASCSVIEVVAEGSRDETSFERERCRFAELPPIACSSAPPALAEDSPIPCWYACQATGCEYSWQVSFCRDAACNPLTPAPPATIAYVECAACDPGGCGDCP